MATTTLAAQLVGEGRARARRAGRGGAPGVRGGGQGGASPSRHLLAHASGLPALAAVLRARRARIPSPARRSCRPASARRRRRSRGASRAAARSSREAVLAEPLEAPPGARARYCDPGFIALGLLARGGRAARRSPSSRSGGCSARSGSRSTVLPRRLEPGARRGARGRARVRAGRLERAAARDVRGRRERRQRVGDGRASPGTPGSSRPPRDVAALGQAWLEALRGRAGVGRPAASRRGVRAPRRGRRAATRALGWDTPSARRARRSAARLGRGPRGAIGHLGFTGTLALDRPRRAASCARCSRTTSTRRGRPTRRGIREPPARVPRRGGGRRSGALGTARRRGQ